MYIRVNIYDKTISSWLILTSSSIYLGVICLSSKQVISTLGTLNVIERLILTVLKCSETEHFIKHNGFQWCYADVRTICMTSEIIFWFRYIKNNKFVLVPFDFTGTVT